MKKDSWRSRVSPSAISRGPDPKRFDGRVYTSLPFVEDERGLVPPRETRRASHLYLVPSAGGEPKQLTSGDLSQRAPDWSPDGRAIVFVQDSTDTSEVRNQVRPQLYVLSVADGAVRRRAGPGPDKRLTSFNDSLLAQLVTIPADTFWFTSVGGLSIEAFVMRPYGYRPGKSYPLILYIHGGPHWNYGNVFFPEMQLLAGQGYWVLLVNPRGSTGYGHDFTFATRGRWGMEDYQDLMKAVDVAIARGGVDTTRLGVAGGSYGGFMTNWVVGHTNRFAAAEADRSIYDWYSWYGSSDAQGLTDYEFSGPPWDADSLYRVLSPITYATRIRTPLLIVHSEDDRRTPITDGEQLFVMLRKRGVPAEFVRYPRSYHGLSRTGPPWLLVDRLERIRTWFAHWLGGGETPPAAGTLR